MVQTGSLLQGDWQNSFPLFSQQEGAPVPPQDPMPLAPAFFGIRVEWVWPGRSQSGGNRVSSHEFPKRLKALFTQGAVPLAAQGKSGILLFIFLKLDLDAFG
ncbi:UNVERIFIED_CONTAM: hypothetical protein K2H54_015286 [Gekko kuhli]